MEAGESSHRPAPSRPLVRLERVGRVYRRDGSETVALRDVSLEVWPGEFVVVMGPSGSGKSTLLHLMGALDLPTSGVVWWDEVDLATLSDAERSALRRRRIGFVFQFFNLLPTLTVLENVCLPALLEDGPARRDEVEARATHLLEGMGLASKRHRFPNELSGGEMQRVAIARALINRPCLILADEPTGNLDSRAGREVLRLLERSREQEGRTVVLVTHDPRAADLGDRLVWLEDGRVVPGGRPLSPVTHEGGQGSGHGHPRS
ncbi:MAG TPA: ABC transporter ATP-binding protein [Limnochordales bacterium]